MFTSPTAEFKSCNKSTYLLQLNQVTRITRIECEAVTTRVKLQGHAGSFFRIGEAFNLGHEAT